MRFDDGSSLWNFFSKFEIAIVFIHCSPPSPTLPITLPNFKKLFCDFAGIVHLGRGGGEMKLFSSF